MNLRFYPFLNLRYNHDLFLFTKAEPLSSFCLFCGQQGVEVLQDCTQLVLSLLMELWD